MSNRKTVYLSLFFLAVIVLILGGVIYFSKIQDLRVVFFDVGQGDAILISQGQNQVLIDGGRSGQVILEKLGRYVPFWDRKIETVVMTHPDQDHIGGFADVFSSYEIGTVIKTDASSDSQTFKALEEYITEEKSETVEAKSGVKIVFSNEAEMEIIHPFGSVSDKTKDTNAASVVSILKNAGFKFMFTGDLPIEKENEILQTGIDVSVDVLKVAHHGSKYSTGEKFLEKVSPREAVISVGKNSYGHPAPEILEGLRSREVEIFRTDEVGDIEYKCNIGMDRCERILSY